jgi:flavin-dependent dehydrogenase
VTFDFDVAVIGGGPAGTSTALHLVRREGIAASRIVVLEKASHPRDKPCAGAVSAWGLDALQELGIPLDVPHVVIGGLRVFAGATVGTHVARLGAVVRRCEFDWSLWRHAAAEGVAMRDNEPLLSVQAALGGWKVTSCVRTVTARFLAACDGSASTVRRIFGLREAARKGHLYVTETPLRSADSGPEQGLCDFDLRVADGGIEGYYWDFPTIIDGQRAVSRGIYHANFSRRSDLKEAFARALAARGWGIDRLRIKPFSTRPLVRSTSLAMPHLVFVGEAAGIDATTGEGIAQAILTGGLAAKHLARAVRSGGGSLDGYAAELVRARVGRHLLQSAWLARRVYGANGAKWRAFLAQDALAREAGARWYAGSPLSWSTKARLGVALGLALAKTRGLARWF